ncbi:MAG: hypothetical protein A2138_18365 [Deltaproteobacteria bacterium RBG_16_71_12]|nr:MAG: hypothetical protein A2138_18365 [Deltaproteobacteria bacterium RBG_16_71_12]
MAPGCGASLLMTIFAPQLTGRLMVVAAPPVLSGSIYFLRGEPVHASRIEGEPALYASLVARGLVAPGQTPEPGVSLVSSLVRRRLVQPIPLLEALRDEVRSFVRSLLTANDGTYRFFDDSKFFDYTPLTVVSPFGLLLEHKRRSLQPAELLRLGEALGDKYPAPLPGFANVAPRLRAFTGGEDLAELVDGTLRSDDLYRTIRLDPLMGGLVVGTLVDAGLIEMLEAPLDEAMVDRWRGPSGSAPMLVAEDNVQLSQLARLPDRGGAEVLGLYLELKPERSDDRLLGVEPGASFGAVERAYEARLAEVDPRAVPSGSLRPYVLSRVEELRTKIERAYRVRMAPAPKAGAGAYELLERVGVGGMAEVFRGRSADAPDKFVAIKRVLPQHKADVDFVRNLLGEARLARRVRHPNVVRVLTAGKNGDDIYLAMEFVDGSDLYHLVDRSKKNARPVPIEVAVRIVAEACAGLQAAHGAVDADGRHVPVLHCDVSTQNILVSVDGEVKLTDFGIAKALEARVESEERAAMVRGKVAYLAPELLEGAPPSVRTDVYAMAMTLYAALARLPYSRREVEQTMVAILREPLPAPSTLRPEVPADLDAVLLRAAARKPDERTPTAQALQLELEEWLAGRPPVDVGGWVRELVGPRREAPPPPPLSDLSRTIPIFDLGGQD